jgi:hypothetical protein
MNELTKECKEDGRGPKADSGVSETFQGPKEVSAGNKGRT